MSSIPPNIVGSVFQAQISAAETAKKDDAQRNKRIRDSKKLEQLSLQHQQEVEDTDHAEGLRVLPEEDKPRNGHDSQDIYQQHQAAQKGGNLYSPDGKSSPPESVPNTDDDQSNPDHIDLSV